MLLLGIYSQRGKSYSSIYSQGVSHITKIPTGGNSYSRDTHTSIFIANIQNTWEMWATKMPTKR